MENEHPSSEELYRDYAETGPIDDPEVWAKYQILRQSIAHLPKSEQISILEAAAELANAQEKAAFLAALRA